MPVGGERKERGRREGEEREERRREGGEREERGRREGEGRKERLSEPLYTSVCLSVCLSVSQSVCLDIPPQVSSTHRRGGPRYLHLATHSCKKEKEQKKKVPHHLSVYELRSCATVAVGHVWNLHVQSARR